MSAHRTDIDKESRRHRGPLVGMFAVVLFALILLGALALWAFRGGAPEGADAQLRTGTGVVEETGGSAVSANDSAEEERGAGSGGQPDPSAVTVAPEAVISPQTGAGIVAGTEPGESRNAEPVSPGTGAAEALQD